MFNVLLSVQLICVKVLLLGNTGSSNIHFSKIKGLRNLYVYLFNVLLSVYQFKLSVSQPYFWTRLVHRLYHFSRIEGLKYLSVCLLYVQCSVICYLFNLSVSKSYFWAILAHQIYILVK